MIYEDSAATITAIKQVHAAAAAAETSVDVFACTSVGSEHHDLLRRASGDRNNSKLFRRHHQQVHTKGKPPARSLHRERKTEKKGEEVNAPEAFRDELLASPETADTPVSPAQL